ncbi:cytochrome c3 family protein [candidate division KSB1 bacterium]|nr:cytochrome c3 family protein [candidate division KSB1 bacterium]
MKRSIIMLFVIGLATGVAFAQTPSVELIFSHKLHAEDVGEECGDCHMAAESSALAMDNLLPDMETCYNCHDREAACSMCHKDPDNAIAYPRIETYIAKFPHNVHVDKQVACERCHEGVAVSDNVFDKHLPGMPVCSSCHDDLEKPDYCYDCHSRDESLRPADHRLDWRKAHAVHKQAAKDDCNLCHTDNECLDCHRKDNLNHQVHPLNYIHNHGLYARGDKERCYTCHEDRSFCVDCHRAEMVYPRSHASAGWALPESGGAHKRAAQADLDECLSCHSDDRGDPICAQCHND